VDIDKNVASRYPVFDRDEFQTMSEADRRGYEARLLNFFPVAYGDDPAAAGQPAPLPEWLLAGTWITASPDRVRDLPKEARSFVNEFTPVPGERADSRREQMVAREFDPPAPPSEPVDPAPPHGDKLR